VRTLGSSSSWSDAKLDKMSATGGQHATFFTRVKNSDSRWAGRALRANAFDDRTFGGLRSGHRADSTPQNSTHASVTMKDAGGESGDVAWDDVVDIVCIGGGAGVLAAAIGAGGAGMTVLLADAGRDHGVDDVDAISLSGRLGVTDPETAKYLDALTQDIGPLTRCAGPGHVPTRNVDGPHRADAGRGVIATFVGSALRDWADACLASPYGLLYTQVSRPATTTTYTSAGKPLEVAVIGSIDVVDGQLTEGLDDWLAVHAGDLSIGEESSSSLQRLVFEGGQVVGAVIDTPTGPRAVRANNGLVIQIATDSEVPAVQIPGLENVTSVEVALVTRPASRFARLELLLSTPSR
jgi:hypothetical protein